MFFLRKLKKRSLPEIEVFFGKTTVHEDLGLFCLFIQRSNLDGGHLNLDGGTLNLNGGMLTLDGGMCPPYNLSRLLSVYETRNSRTLLRKWLVLGMLPFSVPCKRKKVRNFLRHFLTTFWQLQMAFFDFRNYGVFVWL